MNYLEYLSVWDRLEPAQQQTLSAAAVSRSFSKGEILHNGSVECTGLILVCSGRIRAYTISQDGREITLYRLFERDVCLLSASCIMRSIQFDITLEAEQDTQVLIIPSDTYKALMAVSAPLANYTNEVMASRFSDVMWLVDQILWQSFDKRLAEFLLNEAVIEESRVLHITHETIGRHLGHPREVVTRMLRYFQSEGMVRLSRGVVEIVDEDKLHRV